MKSLPRELLYELGNYLTDTELFQLARVDQEVHSLLFGRKRKEIDPRVSVKAVKVHCTTKWRDGVRIQVRDPSPSCLGLLTILSRLGRSISVTLSHPISWNSFSSLWKITLEFLPNASSFVLPPGLSFSLTLQNVNEEQMPVLYSLIANVTWNLRHLHLSLSPETPALRILASLEKRRENLVYLGKSIQKYQIESLFLHVQSHVPSFFTSLNHLFRNMESVFLPKKMNVTIGHPLQEEMGKVIESIYFYSAGKIQFTFQPIHSMTSFILHGYLRHHTNHSTTVNLLTAHSTPLILDTAILHKEAISLLSSLLRQTPPPFHHFSCSSCQMHPRITAQFLHLLSSLLTQQIPIPTLHLAHLPVSKRVLLAATQLHLHPRNSHFYFYFSDVAAVEGDVIGSYLSSFPMNNSSVATQVQSLILFPLLSFTHHFSHFSDFSLSALAQLLAHENTQLYSFTILDDITIKLAQFLLLQEKKWTLTLSYSPSSSHFLSFLWKNLNSVAMIQFLFHDAMMDMFLEFINTATHDQLPLVLFHIQGISNLSSDNQQRLADAFRQCTLSSVILSLDAFPTTEQPFLFFFNSACSIRWHINDVQDVVALQEFLELNHPALTFLSINTLKEEDAFLNYLLDSDFIYLKKVQLGHRLYQL